MSTYDNTAIPTAGRSEAPPAPLWLLIVRGVQGLFALLVLALAANATSYFYLDGYGMAIFTFIWTLLFLLYIFLAPKVLPQFYLFWAHVGFEATVWLFWLVTFALLADYVRAWNSYWGRRTGHSAVDSTRAAFAFALLNWFLFSATLGYTIWSSRSSGHGSATVDGTTHHNSTGAGGGFSFANIFRKKGANDVEKGVGHNGAGTGAVNETGQPVEMQNGAGYQNNVADTPYPQTPADTYHQPTTHTTGPYEQPR